MSENIFSCLHYAERHYNSVNYFLNKIKMAFQEWTQSIRKQYSLCWLQN